MWEEPWLKSKGFTLIETILVLSIIGIVIVTGFSIYSLGNTAYHSGQVRSHVQYEVQMVSDYVTQQLRYASEIYIMDTDEVPDVDAITEEDDNYIFLIPLGQGSSVVHRMKKGDHIIGDAVNKGIDFGLQFQSKQAGKVIWLNVGGICKSQGYNLDTEVFAANLPEAKRVSGEAGTAIRYKLYNPDFASQDKIYARVVDETITMISPENRRVSSGDDSWIIVVDKDLSSRFSIDDLVVENLPQGLSASIQTITPNSFKITVAGIADKSINNIVDVSVIIKNTAMENPNLQVSDPLILKIYPGLSPSHPGSYLISSPTSFTVTNNSYIQGDVVINGNKVQIANNSVWNGIIYVEGDLEIENYAQIGSPDQPSVIFVKGNVHIANNAMVYANIYYEGNLTMDNNAYIVGEQINSEVNIPPVSIPVLESEEWYRDKGYTIVNSLHYELQHGGKYYFKVPCYIPNNSQLYDITIACTSNIVIGNNCNISGILFAPEGEVHIENNSRFSGSITAQKTEADKAMLSYRKYHEYPYETSDL